MEDKEERDKKEWIESMIQTIALFDDEAMEEELGCYYDLIQVNQKVIYLLSNGLLSKPNYKFEVFEEFLEKNFTPKSRKTEGITKTK